MWYKMCNVQNTPQISFRDLFGIPENGVFDNNYDDIDDPCSTLTVCIVLEKFL